MRLLIQVKDAELRLRQKLFPPNACMRETNSKLSNFLAVCVTARMRWRTHVRVCSKVLAAQRTLHNNGAEPPAALLKSPPANFQRQKLDKI
jgi:hypothetical protein